MIRASIDTSLVDWDGRISMVLFVDACNLVCPFCQNWELMEQPEQYPPITLDYVREQLRKRRGWIDAIVLTGGEPLLFPDDIAAVSRLARAEGIALKLDTNGTLPQRLAAAIADRSIDYVAMDIKAPLDDRYHIAAGMRIDLAQIRHSIDLLVARRFPHEFRTTCVPGLIDEPEIAAIARLIPPGSRWFLQAYVPGNARSLEYRHRAASPTDYEQLLRVARAIVPDAALRGIGFGDGSRAKKPD